MRGFVLPGGCVNLLLSISAASADPSKLVLSFGGASFPSEPYLAATQGFNQYFKAAATYYTSNSGTGQNGVFLGRFEVGASDVPINTGLYGTNGTIVAIPAIAGGLVVSYNVPGRNKTKLKFSRKVLPRIFDGTIRQWNDPRLVADNPILADKNKPIIVVSRKPGSGSTLNFVQGLKLMDSSTHFSPSPYDNVQYALNSTVIASTTETAASIVATFPFTISYLGQDEALLAKTLSNGDCEFAAAQHINGEYISCNSTSIASAVSSITSGELESLNFATDGLSILDLNTSGAYPLSVISNFVIRPSNISSSRDTTALALDFMWYFISNPAFATSMSFISLYNTSIGEKSLGYLTSITYHGDQLYGKSICDPLPNGSYIDPCGYGYCANLYPFQDVATQCICSYGYLNVKYDDCSEPMPTFAPSWTSYLNFLFTVTSFFIVIAVSARVFLLREMEDVKAMSLPCCLFVMGGFCLGSISILLHAAIPTAGGCVMSVIINAIAFGMVFSMLFLKSMRIFFIYRYTRMSRFKFLQDSVLISLAAFISLLDGALAAVYTHYSSIQPRLQPLQDSSKEIWICAGTGDDSPLIFLLLFNGALFFLCLAGGYLTRTAQTLFDESKRIGNMIYASTLILVCCLSLLFGLPHTTETLLNVRSVILGGTISIMCTGCPVILFNITSAIAPMNEISITTGKKVAVPLADFKNGEIVKSVALMFYTGMKTKGTLALWDTAVIIVLQEINVVFITKGGTHIFTRFSSCKLKSERDGSANRTRFEMTIENRVEIIEFSSPEKAEAFRSLHIACMVMNSMNALEDQDPVSKSHHPTSSQSPSFRSHFDSV